MRIRFPVIPLLLVAPAAAQNVTITGGASEDHHSYTWTVTNHDAAPITRVEFPHYHGDLVFMPEGWTNLSTGLVGMPSPGTMQPGEGPKLIGEASDRWHAITRGKSLTFGLRISAGGAYPKESTVFVGFADGTSTQINGVECPGVEPWLRRNFPMIGLGASFALFLLIAHYTRKRKSRPSADAAASSAPPDSVGQ